MSYILDALRKSDAQRERAMMPGLHAQTAAAPARGQAPARAARWRWPWMALAALAVLAWSLWSWLRATPEMVPPAAPVNPITVPLAMPGSPPVAAIEAPPAVVVRNDPVPPAAAVALPAAPATPALPAPRPQRAASAPAPKPVPLQAKAEPRVHQVSELPDEIRRELPTLSVGGSVYSSDAASRVLIVNGQLFHERDVLAPGVSLEQIRLKSAVLQFRGYRYSISF